MNHVKGKFKTKCMIQTSKCPEKYINTIKIGKITNQLHQNSINKQLITP